MKAAMNDMIRWFDKPVHYGAEGHSHGGMKHRLEGDSA